MLLLASRHQFVFEGLDSLHGYTVWICSGECGAAARHALSFHALKGEVCRALDQVWQILTAVSAGGATVGRGTKGD